MREYASNRTSLHHSSSSTSTSFSNTVFAGNPFVELSLSPSSPRSSLLSTSSSSSSSIQSLPFLSLISSTFADDSISRFTEGGNNRFTSVEDIDETVFFSTSLSVTLFNSVSSCIRIVQGLNDDGLLDERIIEF